MSKVIAIMNKPKNCQKCVFGICKYSLPLSINRKAYYCQLKDPNGRVLEDFDYDAEVHLSNCPLRELPEQADFRKAKTETVANWIDGWNACRDEILGGKSE